MVSQRIARALLRVAVKRSPAEFRDDNRRQWDAELHLLVAEGRSGEALRRAASLAMFRGQDGPTLTARGLWHAVRLTVIAPLTALGLLALSLVGVYMPGRWIAGWWSWDYQGITYGVLVVGAAVLLSLLGSSWAIGSRATRIVAVVVPGFVVTALVGVPFDDPRIHLPGHAVFFGLLAIVLAIAGWLAHTGRVRTAWTFGLASAFLAAETATVLVIGLAGRHVPSLTPVDYADAATWFLAAYTGLPWGMSPDEAFVIGDVTALDPYFYAGFAGLALGAVLGRKRGRDTLAA